MPVVAITREMGALGRDVADALGAELGVPVIYHEVIDQLADRMRVRKSHVIRLLDGRAGLLERLTADRTSLSIFSADEVFDLALRAGGAVIRGWGGTYLLREVPHVACVRICAPQEVRVRRMLERLHTDDVDAVREEVRRNDEAHTAIMRRHFNVQWTDGEHYDLALNTERVEVGRCVDQILGLVRSSEFAETAASRQTLENLALAARVRAALRRNPETRAMTVEVIGAPGGRVTLVGGRRRTEQILALAEVAAGVPGARDVSYRTDEAVARDA